MVTQKDILRVRAQEEALIERHGWMVRVVFEDPDAEKPTFAYTIGLHQRGAPELIAIGLPLEVGRTLLNDIAKELLSRATKKQLLLGSFTHERWPMTMYVIETNVSTAREFAYGADNRSDGKATYLQVVWPDPAGLFPWQEGFDVRYLASQPLLGLAPQ